MKVTVLFPDQLQVPVGGLGVVGQKLQQHLGDKVDFTWIGQPQPNKQSNYLDTSFPFDIPHGALNTITGQNNYLVNAIKAGKPDLIHAFDWSVFLAGVQAAEYFNVPLVCSMQLSINALSRIGHTYTADPNSWDGQMIAKTNHQIELLGLQKATAIIQVSNAYARYFPDFKDKSVIIQNGIDFDELQTDVRIKLPGHPNRIKLLYIGRFDYMKGITQLLQTPIPSEIDLIIAGSPNGGQSYIYEDILKLQRTSDNVHYIGHIEGERKKEVLNSVDATIMPSLHEPFGIVGLEAMATNGLLLTSYADGISDYANLGNSMYCGTTKESILASLHSLYHFKKGRIEEIKQQARTTALKYSWKSSIEKYFELYKTERKTHSSL